MTQEAENLPDSIFWICSQTKFMAAVRPDSSCILSSSSVYQTIRSLLYHLWNWARFLWTRQDLPPHFDISIYLLIKNVGVVTTAQKPDLKATETDITPMHVLNYSSGLFDDSEKAQFNLPTSDTVFELLKWRRRHWSFP